MIRHPVSTIQLTSCRPLGVSAEQTLRAAISGRWQVRVGPAVEFSLGAAGLSAGRVTEGVGRLVGVDQILASGLR